MPENEKRLRELTDRVNYLARKYHVDDDPRVSDAEYDRLFDELSRLEAESGIVLSDSPTKRVGGEPLKGFEPYRHLARLWSMDKAQSPEALSAWIGRVRGAIPGARFTVEHKFDGLKIILIYDGGLLVNAATRGDGVTGESILAQIMTIPSIPLSIPYKGLIEIQGEGIMRLSALAKYNETASEPLKNARNAAAGALRNLDPKVTASRKLDAFFYDAACSQGDAPYSTQRGMRGFLAEMGFRVSPFLKLCENAEEVIAAVTEIGKTRGEEDFLTDGAVIKLDGIAERDELGYTDRFPRWMIAYKFMAEEITTILEAVTWNVGRTGKLTPLAHLTPVDLGGVTVKRATLNNAGDIRRKKVKLGSRVWIRRSNDVIPEIMGTADENPDDLPEIPAPRNCPHCGSPVIEKGANLFCSDPDGCMPQSVRAIAHFASRSAMDIESLSEKTAELLYNELDVRNPADLYALGTEKLIELEGFGEKRAANLIAAIEKSKNRPLDAFILALGIPNIGAKTAKDLAKRFGSVDSLMAADAGNLTEMDDIGEIVAGSIVDFFSDAQNLEMLEKLKKSGVNPIMEAAARVEGVFSGMTVVITGTLSSMGRKEAEAFVESLGGKAAGSVSKKTSLLVAGEQAGSKLEKAMSLGVRIADEAEFLTMLGMSL